MHAAATNPNSAALSAHAGPAPPTVGYQRRDPEQTLLHQTVRAHWNTLLAEVAQRTDGGSLPGFVRAEFERYVACGVLASGFARVHCGSCGEDILVAFSCKSRGICPSCTTRRMQGTAIHLLDHVLPRVPVRQWVLSLPRWARFLLARDPALITRTLGLTLREIFKHHRRRARRAGARDPRPGAVTMVQRFGNLLNLNVHFHSIITDGNFVREDGVVHFEGLGPPTGDELLVIVQRIAARVNKLLRPRREAALDDARAPDAYASAQAESVSALPNAPRDEELGRAAKKCSAFFEGFSLHAGVHVHASDREGLAHLVGYGARPPLSQERLAQLPDGRLSIRLKRMLPDGRQELVLEPVELLRRLATLVPPPRAHLVRYAGVFGPASRWRKEIVPGGSAATRTCPSAPPMATGASEIGATTDDADAVAPAAAEKPRRSDARIPWAELLQRVFQEDILACPCGGRRKIIAYIVERKIVKSILECLGLPTTAPPMLAARSAWGDDGVWQDDVPTLQ